MLNAFLYDFKKELINDLEWSKFRELPQWALAALGASLILYIISAIFSCYWLFFVSSIVLVVSLIIIIRKTPQRRKKSQDKSSNEASIECEQLQWFLNRRVAVVKRMLTSNNNSLASSECVELLLNECENKLNSTRPSEIFQKRIKPIVSPITIIVLSLVAAWLNNMLPEANISFEESLAQHILSVMKVLASNIVLSRTLMVSFVFVCIYATAIYFAIVFIVLPEVGKFLDRDYLLTAELKDSLLYLKHSGFLADQESTSRLEQ